MIDLPNHSRSYDITRHAERFSGYDSAIEASFFISTKPRWHESSRGFVLMNQAS